MLAYMDFKTAGARILFLTTRKGTLKWFLTSVRHLVRLQMPLGDEGLWANGACKRAFAGVRADVGF